MTIRGYVIRKALASSWSAVTGFVGRWLKVGLITAGAAVAGYVLFYVHEAEYAKATLETRTNERNRALADAAANQRAAEHCLAINTANALEGARQRQAAADAEIRAAQKELDAALLIDEVKHDADEFRKEPGACPSITRDRLRGLVAWMRQ